MVTLDLWNLTWSKADIETYYTTWGILRTFLHLPSDLKEHPLSSKPLHLPLHRALYVGIEVSWGERTPEHMLQHPKLEAGQKPVAFSSSLDFAVDAYHS